MVLMRSAISRLIASKQTLRLRAGLTLGPFPVAFLRQVDDLGLKFQNAVVRRIMFGSASFAGRPISWEQVRHWAKEYPCEYVPWRCR